MVHVAITMKKYTSVKFGTILGRMVARLQLG